MEASPLTRQAPPEVFTPKIVGLYSSLFKDDEDEDVKTEGFWKEFFLLRPDRPALRELLNDISPSEMLLLEHHTTEFFARGVAVLKRGPDHAVQHALSTLSVFLSCILSKKYPHPSSDIITILGGLDQIDTVFPEVVEALDGIIRTGKSLDTRHKAIEVLLAITAGAYQTSLLTYLIQRDLFPSIMKFVQETESTDTVLEPFTLIGLLANYNKFEFQNPYQLRLNDFVNEKAIQKIVHCVGQSCKEARDRYVEVQDDLPEGWTFSSTMNMIGLGAIVPGPKPEKRTVHDAETAKQLFTQLPNEKAAVLLATYDFTHANKLFCLNLVTSAAEKDQETAMSSFLSLTSYLLQHAHLSDRSTYYAHLNLMMFRLLMEDPAICKRICGDESRTSVRLCRHRPPYLPLVKGERVLATAFLDTMVDGINHNLRRRLDISLYTLSLGIMLRLISFLSRSRIRLSYHWSEFFRSLLSLVRFLTTYASDLRDLQHIDTLLDHVVNLVALSLSAGEAFLPTPASYDDLFYKVVESGETLIKFKEEYSLNNRHSNSIDTLISVSTHYKELLTNGAGGSPAPKSRGKQGSVSLTTAQVTEVIKQGYETLSIQAKEGLDGWDRYREADERTLLKKVARVAVADVRAMVEK